MELLDDNTHGGGVTPSPVLGSGDRAESIAVEKRPSCSLEPLCPWTTLVHFTHVSNSLGKVVGNLRPDPS